MSALDFAAYAGRSAVRRRKRHITVDDVVACVRRNGPMTTMQIADMVAQGPCIIAEKVRTAKREGLLCRVGTGERRQLVYGAVQTVEWPGQPQP